ncbi:MAG: hypothetical protein V4850_35465 [Myxococcota bacterium]
MSQPASTSTLDTLFAPRWAGGWTLARWLFAAAALDAHVGRFGSVRDALAAPDLVLSSGPARVADHVLLGAGGAWALWTVGLLGLVGLGFGGRAAKPGLLLWFVAHTVLIVAMGLSVRAPERLLVFVTIGLLLGPISERGLTGKARAPVARWYLIVVFASLYGSTGWMKLLEEPAWWTGEALRYDLVDRFHAGGALAAWLSGQPALCRLLGWGTILFEAGFPFLILLAPLTPWLLAAGLLMHLTIGMLMDVGSLGVLSIAMYPVLVDPDVARTIYERARIRWLRLRR